MGSVTTDSWVPDADQSAVTADQWAVSAWL
jgi:hypothetical protein